MAQTYVDTEHEISKAEKAILDVISRQGGKPISPLDVIEGTKTSGVAETIVRSAIWFLLDRNVISLTNDRKLIEFSHS